MEDRRITGFELLKKIQRGELEDNTDIWVYRGEDLITNIFYNGELNWQPSTFKVSMLWEDELFSFEIMPSETDEWKDIDELVIEQDMNCLNYYLKDNYGKKCYLTKHSRMIAEKVNELIKNQKYLKERLEFNNLNKNITLDEWEKEIECQK